MSVKMQIYAYNDAQLQLYHMLKTHFPQCIIDQERDEVYNGLGLRWVHVSWEKKMKWVFFMQFVFFCLRTSAPFE